MNKQNDWKSHSVTAQIVNATKLEKKEIEKLEPVELETVFYSFMAVVASCSIAFLLVVSLI